MKNISLEANAKTVIEDDLVEMKPVKYLDGNWVPKVTSLYNYYGKIAYRHSDKHKRKKRRGVIQDISETRYIIVTWQLVFKIRFRIVK